MADSTSTNSISIVSVVYPNCMAEQKTETFCAFQGDQFMHLFAVFEFEFSEARAALRDGLQRASSALGELRSAFEHQLVHVAEARQELGQLGGDLVRRFQEQAGAAEGIDPASQDRERDREREGERYGGGGREGDRERREETRGRERGRERREGEGAAAEGVGERVGERETEREQKS